MSTRYDLPFDATQFNGVLDALDGDEELAKRVLSALAANSSRDEQHAGMYGPLRAWRIVGPWQWVNR